MHHRLLSKKRCLTSRSRAAPAALNGRREAGSRTLTLPSSLERVPPIRMLPLLTGPSPLPARTRNKQFAKPCKSAPGSFGQIVTEEPGGFWTESSDLKMQIRVINGSSLEQTWCDKREIPCEEAI